MPFVPGGGGGARGEPLSDADASKCRVTFRSGARGVPPRNVSSLSPIPSPLLSAYLSLRLFTPPPRRGRWLTLVLCLFSLDLSELAKAAKKKLQAVSWIVAY